MLQWKKWRNMGEAMKAHQEISEALEGVLPRGIAGELPALAESVRQVLKAQRERIGELEIREDRKAEKLGGYEGAIDRAFNDLYGPLSGLAGHGKEWVPRSKLVGTDCRARLESLAVVASEAIARGEHNTKVLRGFEASVKDLREEVEELRAEKRAREKSSLVGLDDAPDWARDRVTTDAEFTFPLVERLRVLFGRPHMVSVRVFVEEKPGRVQTASARGWVPSLFRWPWRKESFGEVCAGEAKEGGAR